MKRAKPINHRDKIGQNKSRNEQLNFNAQQETNEEQGRKRGDEGGE